MFRHAPTSQPNNTSVTTAPRSGGGHGILRLAGAALLVAGVGVVYDAAPAAHADTTTVTDAAHLIAAFAAGGGVTLGADIEVTAADGKLSVGTPGTTVTVDLNGHTLEATGATGEAGIGVPDDAVLVIDDSAGGGHIVAHAGDGGAGIGGSLYGGGGTITINGGHITANGGEGGIYGAAVGGSGIGGGAGSGRGADPRITIAGGTVIANGANYAAGIGGGNGDDGGTILITGGAVTATGGFLGAGIGGGISGHGGHITIRSGTVVAQAGGTGTPASDNGAAGIGGGRAGSGGTITIDGGIVTASAVLGGAGIGGGIYGAGGTVTINGGDVTATSTYEWPYGGAGIGSGHFAGGVNLTIGSAASVSVAGAPGRAVGGDEESPSDIITNDGTLTLLPDNSITIGAGDTFVNNGTLVNRGMISGKSWSEPGMISGSGTVDNRGLLDTGTLLLDSEITVTGYYYTLHFESDDATAGTPPPNVTVWRGTPGPFLPYGTGLEHDGCLFGDWFEDVDDLDTGIVAGTDLSLGGTRLSTGVPVIITAYPGWDCSGVLKHTVTFDSNGGSAVAPQHVVDGVSATEPDPPTRDGYTFAGWFEEITGGPWELGPSGYSILLELTLIAHWTAVATASPTAPPTTSSTAATPTESSAPTTSTPAASSRPATSTQPASTTPRSISATGTPAPSNVPDSGRPGRTTSSSSSVMAPLPPDSDSGTPVFHLDDPTPSTGDPITLSADGFLPGSVVFFWLHSHPVYLGAAIADARGVAALTVSLDEAVAGDHHLQALGTGNDGTPRNIAQAVTITQDTAALASTGVDPTRPLMLALLLLLGGAALLTVERRLRTRTPGDR